jgi:ribose 1,5-bisphosphate isomerase
VSDVDSVVRELERDRTSGASALSRRLAQGLADFVRETGDTEPSDLLEQLRKAALAIATARPSMRALANTAGLIVAAAAEPPGDLPSLRQRVLQAVEELLEGWDAAAESISSHALSLLPDRILTYSYSSTVLAAIKRPRPTHIVVCESRPLYEGRTLAAELSAVGLRPTVITDAQADYCMSDVAAVLVGADALLADGSLVNKVGTTLIALAARRHGVPFYVACESLKVCPEVEEPFPPEEKEPQEVWADAPAGVTVHNVYFERTPADLVSAIITERGVFPPDGLGPLVEQTRRYSAALRDPSRDRPNGDTGS